MQDEIILGTGNSRYLKSAIPSGTTWEQALEQLREGTFPIDLNGKNNDGIAQQGTPLNKANLLSDATASAIRNALGTVSAPSVVDDALNAVCELGRVVFHDVYTASDIGYGKSVENSYAGNQAAGASVGSYALFAGGYATNTTVDTVVAYDENLTKTIVTSLSNPAYYLSGCMNNNYAIFAGGMDASSAATTSADAYNASLTKVSVTGLSVARTNLATANNGEYALFVGGYAPGGAYGTYYVTADAYNTSLTRSTPTGLINSSAQGAGARAGSYAIITGGYAYTGSTTFYNSVVKYDTSLSRTTGTLSTKLAQHAGGWNPAYAFFVGGSTGSSNNTTAHVFDTSGTLSTTTGVTVSSGYKGSKAGRFAIFAGDGSQNVLLYDTSKTKYTKKSLSVTKSGCAIAYTDNLAFVTSASSNTNIANADAIFGDNAYELSLTIPPLSKYKFDGVHGAEQLSLDGEDARYVSFSKFSGYIKRGGFTLSGLI